MFGKSKGNAKNSPNKNPNLQPESLGTAKKPRRARLLKPNATQSKPKTDVIMVSITGVYLKTEPVQSTKKINLTKVVGKEINIPVGGMNNSVVVYKVEVNYGNGQAWKLEKTYMDFYQLHQRMNTRFPGMAKLFNHFPKRKLFLAPNINSPKIEYRQKFFQAYLQGLLQLKPRLSYVNDFLEIHLHANPTKKKDLTIDDFELLKLLGKGSFGKVFLVRVIGSKDLYAMKVLRKSEVKKRRQIEHTKTELRVMGGADHPFICCLRYAFHTDTRLFMVSEFCQGGELFFHLKQMRCFSNDMVRFYAAEIALALNYLHSRDIIYRDIKPENVLLDDAGHIKITDFGLSRDNVSDPQGATTFCGTPEYLSPEMLLGRQRGYGYGKSVDWWGLGVLMYEMFFGWPPFYDRNKKVMCRKILKGRLVFNRRTNVIEEEAKDIITSFLERNPENRLGIRGNGFPDVQEHPFFNGIDWEQLFQKKIEPPFKPKITNAINNFDPEFTDQSARISEHEKKESEPELEDADEEDVFEDFNFSRDTASPDAFWDAN